MRHALLLALFVTMGAPARAQAPAQEPPAGQPKASAGQEVTPPPAADAAPESTGFTYDPEGRRDPFVSLLRSGSTGLQPADGRPSGLAGLGAAEVTLKGTIASDDEVVGILLGADGQTYIVRPGDRLLDGTIRSVTEGAIVIVQQVNDPLSLDTQREVRKTLRQTDEAN